MLTRIETLSELVPVNMKTEPSFLKFKVVLLQILHKSLNEVQKYHKNPALATHDKDVNLNIQSLVCMVTKCHSKCLKK